MEAENREADTMQTCVEWTQDPGPRTQECSAGGIIIMLLLHVNAQGHNGLQSAFKF